MDICILPNIRYAHTTSISSVLKLWYNQNLYRTETSREIIYVYHRDFRASGPIFGFNTTADKKSATVLLW